MSTTSDTNKALTQQFFEEVFNNANYDVAKLLLSPDYSFNGSPPSPHGIADTIAWAQSMRAQFPDLHFDIEDILAEGDKVALRWRMTGTFVADKVKRAVSGTNIILWVGGKAVTNIQGGGLPKDLVPPLPQAPSS